MGFGLFDFNRAYIPQQVTPTPDVCGCIPPINVHQPYRLLPLLSVNQSSAVRLSSAEAMFTIIDLLCESVEILISHVRPL